MVCMIENSHLIVTQVNNKMYISRETYRDIG